MGGGVWLLFSPHPVSDFAAAKTTDTELFGRFHSGMLRRGIHLAPPAFESGFVSATHEEAHIQKTIAAAHATFQEIQSTKTRMPEI